MASNKLLTLTIVAIFLPAMAMATDFIVGDDSGWTLGYDYQAWAKDKVFRVGDKLVFQYPVGVHNVLKVNGTSFKNCDTSQPNATLSSGNDTIVLATPGKKWYICGFPNHCAAGQKLNITVQPASYGWAPPAPVPTSPSAPTPQPWAPVPSQPWTPAPAPTPSVPRTPPFQPWTPGPAPTPQVPATPTHPWAPAPVPSSPWA